MNYSKEPLTNNKNTPSPPESHEAEDKSKKTRSSNLELYRIVSMLMIVAHHYVVNSGLGDIGGPILQDQSAANSLYLALFGAWGKVGINCFLMITGYFMCTARITVRKFFKLMLQIYLYKFLIFPIMLIAGYESVSFNRIIRLVMPVWGFSVNNFTSCFIAFWLTIPYLNILVKNLCKRDHEVLIILSLFLFTLSATIPNFQVPLNYITWFGIIYIIASYIRLYPQPLFERRHLWGWLTIVTVLLSIASIVGILLLHNNKVFGIIYFFVTDSNKLLPVIFAFCSFLWFRNINIKYNIIINAFGAGTFGVLLIHANSNAMRTWLWRDTVDCVGHYFLPLGYLVLYSVGVVLAIFVVCNLIDQLRINTLEKWFFNWYDKKCAAKADVFINRLLTGK